MTKAALTRPVFTHTHGRPSRHSAPKHVRIILALVIIPLLLAAIASALILRPGPVQDHPALGTPTDLVNGTATEVLSRSCQDGVPESGACSDVGVFVEDGPDAGKTVNMTITEGPGQPQVSPGDALIIGRTDVNGQVTYYFMDFQRGNGLALLGIAFVVIVLAVARRRGLGALIGLIVTFLIITKFVLPSILDGNSPVLVTVVGAALIIIVVLYVAHGINARTSTAIIGTLASLAIVGAGSSAAVKIANITGLSTEEVSYIQAFASTVNIEGLLLAGIILGGLGVLNDMTVSQASSVWELHDARPDASRREIYTSAMRVGRDHIASTIYTLVLAYTGAALPLLILFTLADRDLASVLTSDIVGEEIVRAIVGGIGLIASVPITTGLAAMVVKSMTLKKPDGNSDDSTDQVASIEQGDANAAGVASNAGSSEDTHDESTADQNSSDESVAGESVAELRETLIAGDVKPQTSVGDKQVQKLHELLTNPKSSLTKKRRWPFNKDAAKKVGKGNDAGSGTLSERPMSRKERKFWEGS